MKKSIAWALSVLTLLVFACIARPTDAISCGDAVGALIPCGSFLMGGGAPRPSAQCCQGAQSLNKLATSPVDRRTVCECFVKSGPSFGVKPERVKLLPSLCKLKLALPVNSKTDCKNV